MGSPYTSQSASSYNSSPPADDGSQVTANRVTWAGVKSKLADPVKTLADNINSALVTAFGKILGANGVRSTAVDYTVISADQGKLIKVTASGVTITTPDATSVGSPFAFSVLNNSSGSITIDGNGSQTVDGTATISIPSGGGVTIETDGTNWLTHGQNYVGTISDPQGRLTLTSGAPVQIADVSAATSVYYSPYVGNLCPIYNGSIYQMRTFSELTLTLVSNSNYAASTIFDIFIFDSSGTVTIGMGPAWSTSTAGSGARGSGAGTTELERKLGFWTNKNSITLRNSGSTYTVSANQATYVGSIAMDASNGQVSTHVTSGQSRKRGLWNAYNRVPSNLLVNDSTASWTYNVATTWRQSNAAAGNTATVLCGLAEEPLMARFSQFVISAATKVTNIGIGWNATNASSGRLGQAGHSGGAEMRVQIAAEYDNIPAIGTHSVNCIEQVSDTTSETFLGGSTMQMVVSYRS